MLKSENIRNYRLSLSPLHLLTNSSHKILYDPVSMPGYRQFRFIPEIEVHTYYNSQGVTVASV